MKKLLLLFICAGLLSSPAQGVVKPSRQTHETVIDKVFGLIGIGCGFAAWGCAQGARNKGTHPIMRTISGFCGIVFALGTAQIGTFLYQRNFPIAQQPQTTDAQ